MHGDYAVDIDALIEDELLMLRHSGEIPEIALHHSIHFLLNDPEGPRLKTIPEDALGRLKQAVYDRYRVIVLRDLKPANRDLSIYRGPVRSIMNFSRMERFCNLESFDIGPVREEAARLLENFLSQELDDVKSGRRKSVMNCTFAELTDFALKLGLSPQDLPPGLEDICPSRSEYDF